LTASGIISEDKIRWEIAGFGPWKTAGEDGIFQAGLKNGIEVLINPLRKIFTAWSHTKTVAESDKPDIFPLEDVGKDC
jgi:hypothetical protein